nr:hypothetical protein GCM10025732_42850 [Glycomyces mayteni]
MIAMALACDPDLIIADEATTALDVMVQAQVLQLISGLVKERGVGLVMISHDLSVLSATCDTAAVMYAGRVVEQGPAHEVFARARHPYSAALGAAFPVIGDPASRRNPGVWRAIRRTRGGCRRAARSGRGARWRWSGARRRRRSCCKWRARGCPRASSPRRGARCPWIRC